MKLDAPTAAEFGGLSPGGAGSLLAGRFRIERWLGSGSCGAVYAAYDAQRGTRVALKLLQVGRAEALLRFKREFRALADISHTNLVTLHELYADGGRWFFTMELVNGTNLLDYIRGSLNGSTSAPAGSSPEPDNHAHFARLRAAFHQLATGLTALHAAGCLHRDLKPSNVLVTPQGRVVVLDFGLVADLRGDGIGRSTAQQIVGTAAYMAPEQATLAEPGFAADWYSVGVMLHEALTGKLPFDGTDWGILLAKQQREAQPPVNLNAEVPADLNALCTELLQSAAALRPSSDDVLRSLPAPSGMQMPDRIASSPTPRTDAVIGRERELEMLHASLGATLTGHPVVVTVHGTSGVGKSALIRRFSSGIADMHEVVVLSSRCYERESVPYKAVDGIVDALARYLSRLDPLEAAAILPRDASSLVQLFPVLERVLPELVARSRNAPASDAQDRRQRAFAAMQDLLARLAERCALVLAIDDVQWGDVDSAALLASVLRGPASPVMLLVMSYRSEDVAASPFLGTLSAALDDLERANGNVDRREIELGPLNATSSLALARTMLERTGAVGGLDDVETDSTSGTADWIAKEAQGSPFFIGELAQYARSVSADSDLNAGKPRPSLEQALSARVRTLTPESRALLEIVAVSGLPISADVAFRAARLLPGQWDAIAALRSLHLIRSRGAGDLILEAYHDRIRETVIANLAPQLLHEHHQRLADALEEAGNGDPEALAIHYREAGAFARAADYAATAAERAANALAVDRAVRLYRMALELIPSENHERVYHIRVKLGDALANAGRGPESADMYLQAAGDGVSADAVELRRRAAEQFIRSGHLESGLQLARDVLKSVGIKMYTSPARIIFALAANRAYLMVRGRRFTARSAGDIREDVLRQVDICWTLSLALSVAEPLIGALFQSRQLLLALRAGEPHRVARAIATDVGFSAFRGSRSAQRTTRVMRDAESAISQLGDSSAAGVLLLTRGMAAFLEGRFIEAPALFDAAEKHFSERGAGTWWEITNCRMFAVRTLYYTGRFARATEQVDAAVAVTLERGDLYAAAALLTSKAMALLVVADAPDRSLHELARSAETWKTTAFDVPHFSAMLAHAETDLYSGRAAEGWERLTSHTDAIRQSRLLTVQFLRVLYFDIRCRCALAAANINDIRRNVMIESATRDIAELRKTRVAWASALATSREAAILSLRNDRAGALARIQSAASELSAVGLMMYSEAARRRVGELQGGIEGINLIGESESRMRAESVGSPERVADLYAPGFQKN